MPIEVDVKLDRRSLSRFLIYHNYVRVSGVIGVILSLAALVALCLRWGMWTPVQRGLLVVLALMFTVLQPVMLVSKGRKQLAMEEFQIPFHYCFDENGVSISQKDQSQSFGWKEIRKAVFRKDAVYVYMSSVSAFVIPRDQCGGRFDDLVRIIRERKNEMGKDKKTMVQESFSEEDTRHIGQELGRSARPGEIFLLEGELGTGKTVLARGFAEGLGIDEPVTSPTFTIIQEYEGGRIPFYHFDVYRIADVEEMYELGYEGYFFGEGVCLVEWASLIREILPPECRTIRIEKDLERGFDYRRIMIAEESGAGC